jgi:hypothetical protein
MQNVWTCCDAITIQNSTRYLSKRPDFQKLPTKMHNEKYFLLEMEMAWVKDAYETKETEEVVTEATS